MNQLREPSTARTNAHFSRQQDSNVAGSVRDSVDEPDNRRHASYNDRGATLILAMAFLVAVCIVVVSLSNWVGNDLNNTAHFTSAHALETAANDATETAIENVRYSFSSSMVNASPPVPCWTTGSTPGQFTLTGVPTEVVNVWCSTLWAPESAATRTVTFSTCLSSVSATACQANPELQAVMVFDDYPYPSGVASSSPCTTTGSATTPTCGEGMTVQSWIFNPVVPTVTGITPATGSPSGGTSLTITGTGFASGAGVNFVDANGYPTNWVLPASSVTVNSSGTSITVRSPATPTSSSDIHYNVVVVTPEGTSAISSASAFKY
jgi:hypothetical protein